MGTFLASVHLRGVYGVYFSIFWCKCQTYTANTMWTDPKKVVCHTSPQPQRLTNRIHVHKSPLSAILCLSYSNKACSPLNLQFLGTLPVGDFEVPSSFPVFLLVKIVHYYCCKNNRTQKDPTIINGGLSLLIWVYQKTEHNCHGSIINASHGASVNRTLVPMTPTYWENLIEVAGVIFRK